MNNKKDINASLSKFLAQAGVASRRKVVDVIKFGVVAVNGTIIKEPGYKVLPKDVVTVENKTISVDQKIYIMLNKPKDCITTTVDSKDRRTVLDLLSSDIKERIYPVGRLDRNSTGVLILTNDGDMALRLSHPRYEVSKVYHVTVDRLLQKKDVHKLLEGVELEDGVSNIDTIHFFKNGSKKECLIVIHSGKNRIIRRMLAFLGYEVLKLDRIEYAGLTKEGLSVGAWRHLTPQEIALLKNSQ